MGKHIATNLIGAGLNVKVNDVRPNIYEDFERQGAEIAKDVSHLDDCEVVFLCLPSAAVVREVILGEKGLVKHLRAGQVIVDLSTISYNATLELHREIELAGGAFLDAPISGMEARAKNATLTVMCGGHERVFTAIEPLLKHIGNNILYMGEAGAGQLTKLINQLLFDINVAGLAEILPMAAKMGLDPEKVGSVINSGTGRSYASEFFIPNILNNQFDKGYPLSAAYKDLVSATEFAASALIPLPVLSAATVTYQQALRRGHGALDKGAMVLVFEELLGVTFRSRSMPEGSPANG
jgi:3-hydroxyisobutyrate dehydrogenase-like beta-hydroxyacid dehydrogenase